jgi:uncharacterized protein
MTMMERVEKDLGGAMKRQETLRLSVLRMMKAALKLKQVQSGKPVEDEQAYAVLRTLLKQRREAAEMFRQGGRSDLAEKELAETEIVESYLPPVASDAEVDVAIAAALDETGASTPKDLGKAIRAAMARLAGKTVDGSQLTEKVRARLGAST